MEKEGIGRPSTYASIIGTIIDRGYVKKDSGALVPTFTAMVVSKLLSTFLQQYVDLNFTSKMEKSLDDIADGELDSESYLGSVYLGKQGLKSQVEAQADKIEPSEAREIKLAGMPEYAFRVGKYGAYVVTTKNGEEFSASIPESASPADMTAALADKLIEQKIKGADALGKDPKTGLPIYALSGRYGPYVQLGDIEGDDAKPKRVSIPANIPLETISLPQALELLSLPKTLGMHPTVKKEIKAGLGRFGPFVVCDGDYRSIPKTESIFQITLARALELFAQPKRGRGRAAPLKELGAHPQSGEAIQVMNGPYGPYVKSGKTNVSLPEDMKVDDLTLEKAIELLNSKAGVPKKTKSKAGGSASKGLKKTKVSVAEKTPAKGATKAAGKSTPKALASKANKTRKAVEKRA
jgi:DNA topoisomerase-1